MLRCILLFLLAVLCTTASVALADDKIALDFTSEIVLQDALLNTPYNVTSDFTKKIAKVLQHSLSAPGLDARVYSVYPHLVVLSEAWYSGETKSVLADVDKVNATYRALVADGDPVMSVSGTLSYQCVQNIGRQPSAVHYTNNCRFFNEALPSTTPGSECLRDLSVSIYTNSSNPTAMRAALCNFLPTDCELITISTVSQVNVPISGTQVPVFLMPVTISSQDREATLALLVAYTHYASFLVEQRIVYILVDGVRVFYQGDLQLLSITGTMAECAQRMWYLIFLIILVPVILIISQRMFYWGRRSGRRSIKNSEKDIRAGVHLSSIPWANLGTAGYQYGPPQGYPGGYGGAGMQPQDNPYMHQRDSASQFYGQQWSTAQFGGPQQQQQYGGFPTQVQRQGPPGSLANRNAQWSYSGQQLQPNLD
ncbi:hypothetical protein ABL78_6605 [Leptomonas seymouri]|uniref:Uncharacterized protein n=1 Tax=Leptomonas seymouri TaxID=5684 RepID=A0A0N1I0L6_LEPSE|nr:hypothetical protein ABL78_6605 [Leptomonas seymouri]|eukprot:KPI84350.1 hypothetical protein ABL78_6605 [Leptomonas seymouri]